MSLLEDAKIHVAPYVPSLQRTEGQPPPVAANGGLSYMSFDDDELYLSADEKTSAKTGGRGSLP